MTMEDEPLIVAERDVRSAIEAVTVLSNLVATIGEHEAVAAAHGAEWQIRDSRCSGGAIGLDQMPLRGNHLNR